MTSFIQDHPGGSKIILKLAGTDATEEYDPIHPPGTLEESLKPEQCLGTIDENTLPNSESPSPQQSAVEEEHILTLDECLNLDDIEAVATKKISKKAWAYYFSAGDDLFSKYYNNHVFRKILLRPRIFVDCTRCDTSTTLLGHKLDVPLFISPAAMARLGHPDGEHGMAKACAKYGALQIISHNASQTPEQIAAGCTPDQMFGWQLYVQNDRAKSETMIARINKLSNVKFLCLTLDAPVPGKREDDERTKTVSSSSTSRSSSADSSARGTDVGDSGGGVGRALFAGTAADLTWRTTLPWLAKHTKLPIVLKGIQTHEDAYLASLHAPQVKAIVLSNHGGRAIDTAPPAVHTLMEIRKYCPEVFDRTEVWVDGGIRRGTDVVKALCLGAKAVGVGRAPLWGLGAGGQAGVERVFDILKTEVETCMRLLGVERIEELGLQHVSSAVTESAHRADIHQVNTRLAENEIYDGPANIPRGFLAQPRAKL